MIDFGTLAIGGVSIPALVLGWVSAAKELGLKGRWLTALALVLSTLCAGLWQAVAQGLVPEDVLPWVTVVVVGLGGGVALTGWYDLARRAGASLLARIGGDQVGQ